MQSSLVIPAYNEEDVLRDTTMVAMEELDAHYDDYELILVDNNSDDDTPGIAESLSTDYDSVRWTQEPKPGRGLAVAKGFTVGSGDVLAFIDADMATDIGHLQTLIDSVRIDSYDVATGSRWIPGAKVDRPINRTVPSKTYNFLVRTLLGSSLYDHQCGFKAFSNRVVDDILDNVRASHWFWDTEMLVLAQTRGYQINEFSVEWTPQPDSSIDLKRDAPQMLLQILELLIRTKIQSLSDAVSLSRTNA